MRYVPAHGLQDGHSTAGGADGYQGCACTSPKGMALDADNPPGDAPLAVINYTEAHLAVR